MLEAANQDVVQDVVGDVELWVLSFEVCGLEETAVEEGDFSKSFGS